MDTDSYVPIPPHLQGRLRTLTNDLHRARANLMTGRLKADQFAALERVLDERLRDLEAEVQFRLLNEARMGRGGNAALSWKPKGGHGAS